MELIEKNIQNYLQTCTTSESLLLKTIERETRVHVTHPNMISGSLQGRVLAMLSKMIAPSTILEIGTYTGYSALCLAEGLTHGGCLITLDINEELEARTRKYLAEADFPSIIFDYRLGDAKQIIPLLREGIDLVFIDADKESYSMYYDMVFDKVVSGGYILADNILWGGKVLDEAPDKRTRSILRFNEKIMHDDRVENVPLPIRDGIMIIRKK